MATLIPAVLVSFNPRSRTGSDHGWQVQGSAGDLFQSTLPHGERPQLVDVEASRSTVSIHAPARGATYGLLHKRLMAPLFQSTLPHGERLQTVRGYYCV